MQFNMQIFFIPIKEKVFRLGKVECNGLLEDIFMRGKSRYSFINNLSTW